MELIWNEIEAERLICETSEQVHVSGEIPVPNGASIRDILSFSAETVIEGCYADNGSLSVRGQIKASILAADTDNEYFTFESAADFQHELECEKSCSGMKAEVFPVIQTLEVSPRLGTVVLKADVDMDFRLTDTKPVRTVAGVSGLKDLEMKNGELRTVRRVLVGDETLRLREELSCDGCRRVLKSEGFITVRDVSADDSAAAVSGTITVCAVAADDENNIVQLVRQVPFRERIHLSMPASEPCCKPELRSIVLRTVEDDPGVTMLEAEVRFVLYGRTESEYRLPEDAFSPTIGFDCLCENAKLIDRCGIRTNTLNLREEVALGAPIPLSCTPAISDCRAVITDAVNDNSDVRVNGVLITSICFAEEGAGFHTETAEIPFDALIENASCISLADVSCRCACNILSNSGESVLLQYTISLSCEDIKAFDRRFIVGLAEREPAERMKGVVVCFTSSGERVYDVAKRYGVSCESVNRLNPEAREPFKEGEKLVLMM